MRGEGESPVVGEGHGVVAIFVVVARLDVIPSRIVERVPDSGQPLRLRAQGMPRDCPFDVGCREIHRLRHAPILPGAHAVADFHPVAALEVVVFAELDVVAAVFVEQHILLVRLGALCVTADGNPVAGTGEVVTDLVGGLRFVVGRAVRARSDERLTADDVNLGCQRRLPGGFLHGGRVRRDCAIRNLHSGSVRRDCAVRFLDGDLRRACDSFL